MSYAQCYECGKVIESDEVFWSVDVNKQTQRDWVIIRSRGDGGRGVLCGLRSQARPR